MEEKVLSIEKIFPVSLSAKAEVFVFACISLLSLMMPFAFGHPQWLVGTIVNAILFLAVLFLPKKYWLPLIVFPSLGVLARGLMFGPFTFFLVYFMPFIWIGNYVLMLVFEKIIIKNYVLAAAGASLAKFLVLFLIASVFYKLHIVPALFLQTMGLFQLENALAGGLISFLILKVFANYKIKK